MDDAVLFNGHIINQEIIFNANMNELRLLARDGECISLNTPTARCLLLLLQNCGKIISWDEFLVVVWETWGVVVSRNTLYQNISLLRKSLVKAELFEDIIITVRQKGSSAAPNTLVILPFDEECESMNRVTLMHHQNNKAVGFISEDKEKPDTHLDLPLIENPSNHGSDLMANKTEEDEKVSERLHVTFRILVWLIALIVVMIAIDIIVLVVLNR